ncbi:hypothetical protein, partial [Rhodococcus rhodnii]
MSTETAGTATAPEHIVKVLDAFASRHGGSASAVLQPVSRGKVRITLVGEDGVIGDQLVQDVATAEAAVNAADHVTTSDGWTRELTSIAEPAPGHWAKMAAWVAHQTRFP